MRFLSALALLATTGIATGASAQAGEEVWAGPGGWRVLDQQVNCALFGPLIDGQPRVALALFARGDPLIEITLPQPLGTDLGDRAELHIGSERVALIIDRNRRELSLLRLPVALQEGFRTGTALHVLAGDRIIAEIPLEGSAAAYGSLEQCRAGLATGPFVPPRAPELHSPPGTSGPKSKP